MAPMKALIIKDLRAIARDLHALGLLLGMPLIFIFILSMALDGLYGKKSQIALTVSIDDQDGGAAAAQFGKQLRESGLVTEVTKDRTPQAVIRIPAGMSNDLENLMQGNPVSGAKIVIVPSPSLDVPWQLYIKAMAQKSIMQVLISKLNSQFPEGTLPVALKNMENIVRPEQFFTEATPAGEAPPSPLQTNIPGWTVFAMFMIAMPLATGMIRERDSGLTARLMTTPVPPWMLTWAHFIPGMIVSLVQFSVVMGASLLVAPWIIDQPITLKNVGISFALAAVLTSAVAVSFALVVGRLSRTVEQASTMSAGIVVVCSALGGIMVPVFAMPHWLRELAHCSPIYWSHQSLLSAMIGSFRWGVEGYYLLGLGLLAMVLAAVSQMFARNT
ncbi:MAG: ABC transporter permease [Proteobacteria bacterium]|nr:ABC transporter permease [Pseudomonadota bacterium]